jgi:rhamnogalacturonyl hydrolase YesR
MIDMDEKINSSLLALEKFVRKKNYSGIDPYDALNSDFLNSIKNKFIRVLITQIFVYNPINLRSFFQINSSANPKAIGLFLSAYCNLYKKKLIEKELFESSSSKLVNLLMKHKSKKYSDSCWGFNFFWQSFNRSAERWLPTIVVTSYVGNSLLDLYEITKDRKYLDISNSICRFILNDLNITENEKGICFSYTPIDNQIVHNANLLGAAFLTRVYNLTHNEKLFNYSLKAFDFSLSYQNKDGSWAYSINPKSKKERNQIDFHQGFILDSIIDFINYSGIKDKKYMDSLIKGSRFYLNNQFDISGQSKWRLPLKYPIDIHHQAQGIITFSKLYKLTKNKKYKDFTNKITRWTIKNMYNDKGYFYYQKWPLIINKISYMRWGQAWMMLGLSKLPSIGKEE